MKKIIANNKQVAIAQDVLPEIKPSYIIVKTQYSAVSPGTELSMIDSSAGKEIPLGYSAMGIVEEIGDGITDVAVGDLVACYGAPYVHHAEYLLVPKTLYAKVPSGMDPKAAAFAGIGAIALHALRIAKLQLGETVVIVGLGLLGQMIAKIANAAAYRVIAYDLSTSRVAMMSEEMMAFSRLNDLEEAISRVTGGNGADAVLLCSGGKRTPLTHQSLNWIRNKGKVVIVGDVEPDFPRDLMFGKEAEILISRAGGPGRYDKVYEADAVDYPYEYVRWTEGRNIGEYIRLVHEGFIDVTSFIKDEIEFAEAPGEFIGLTDKKSDTLTKLIRY